MKRELNILIDELRRLKEKGVRVISVSDQTMEQLRRRSRQVSPGPAAEPSSSAPDVSRREKGLSAAAGGSVPQGAAPAPPPARKLPPAPTVTLPEGDKQTRWAALRDQVLSCPTCNGEVKPGRKVVFGVGNLDAEIFFVGEAPGQEEEIIGEPFVGKAGETLTRMIAAMGLRREDVYIGNIMNWRPSMPTDVGNRPPTQEEMEFCLPYLLAQIDIVQPKVLVALGSTAIAGLFGADPKRRMMDVRGRWKDFREIPTMMTYHPAYLVRNASNKVKRMVWEDLLQVMEKVGLPISEKQRGYFLPKG